ncbi:bifunctional 5,10-methylenetetrahydrofolate dehydrogenase/5,10-methenyltetrahydrofolate cyclohydrolase [Paenarthrobacter nitroguajacolicus]|uniref:bifunctional 5,10-methylenetetrahydrofolate dehydrogenase/5,10-methenyltetrahydrofolate cyclohydrolase n=1 Tax=Paenarthrobacter nitroguajacolicus TaxID=211146 RepID=UPI003D1B816F
MSAVLMDGKLLASKVREEVKTAVAAMVAAGQAPPGLATVLIGDDPASEIYVRNKRRMCVEAGMQDHHQHLPGNVSHQEAIDLVDALAVNPLISGILVQLPVPGTIVAEELLSRIPAAKDVDGLTVANAGLLAQGLPGHRPCTPAGIVRLLDEYAVALEGATAVVVGRSRLVGKPMAQLLLERNATVTIAHSRTRNLTEVCRNADILIAAAGVPGVITGDAIRPGATVIDVGIHRDGNRLRGDVDFAAASKIAARITPVPGGVGPMTIAMLLANTLKAAQDRQEN